MGTEIPLSMEIRKFILLAFQFSSVFFLPIHVYTEAAAAAQDICEHEARCSPDGPAVKFPFLLKDKQPKSCSYPGLELYCDNQTNTVLELPSSAKFFIKSINYKYHFIQVADPQGCPLKQLRNLNLSSSLLQFPSTNRFSLFNCSLENPQSTSWYPDFDIDCLNSPGYRVHAVTSETKIRNLQLELCTKMYDTEMVSEEIFGKENLLQLNWTLPLCEACYDIGGTCRLKDGTERDMICIVNDGSGKSLNVLIITGAAIGGFIVLVSISVLFSACYKKKKAKENEVRIKKFLEDYAAMKPTRYSYADMKRITEDFKDKLGEGAYGIVFRGKILNVPVAVKLLHDFTGNGEEFINEVGTIGRIHHVNVVRLIGFCADGSRRALVYEFLPNGSLDKFIFAKGEQQNGLGWEKLQDIALGIAKGIEYLHQGCEQRILHFDIKPHNILLDNDFNPKISDFGLAKLCERGKSAVSMTAARGTMGYMAPEVYSRHFGNVSYKSDIYSFGMLLLEMVGHRRNFDESVQNVSQVNFPEWVYRHLANGKDIGFQVEDWGENKIARKLATIGLWCIRWNPVDRPSMTFVLQMLEGDAENLSLPPNPFTSTNSTNPRMHKGLQDSGLEVITESEMKY